MFFTRDLCRGTYSIPYCQYIVAIYTLAAHIIGTGLAVEFAHSRPLFNAQPHTIQVIDHKIDDGETIDFREVERFMKRASVGGSITHLAGYNFGGVTIGNGKSRPSRQRQLATYDGISPHKVAFYVK